MLNIESIPSLPSNSIDVLDTQTSMTAKPSLSKSITGGALTTMMQGFSKLNDFSDVLSSCLNLLDSNVAKLESVTTESASNIKLLNLGIHNHGSLLSKIEVEVTDQRNKLMDLVKSVNALRSNAISSTNYPSSPSHNADPNNLFSINFNESFTKDGTKPINKKDNLLRSLADTTYKYSQAISKMQLTNTQASSPTNVPALPIISVEERLTRIEQALFHQDQINKLFGAISRIPESNSIDDFSDKDTPGSKDREGVNFTNRDSPIKVLENEVISLKMENDSLRKLIVELNTKVSFIGDIVAPGKTDSSSPQWNNRRTPKTASARGNKKFFKNEINASSTDGGSDINSATEDTDEQDKFNYNDRYEKSAQMSETLSITTRKLSNAIDDIYVKFEVLKSRIEAMSKESSADNPDRILQKRINTVRDMWNKIRNDLNHGLSVLTEQEEARNFDPASEGDLSERNNLIRNDPLISKSLAFLTQLEESMASFDLLRTGAETAMVLFPVLDSLTISADELLTLDNDIKTANKSSLTLSDIVCLDNTANLRPQLLSACSSSIPILEEVDDKILIRRRMDKIDLTLNRKADFASLKNSEVDIKRLIDTRISKDELKSLLDKKASLSDLERLKDILHRKIDSMIDLSDVNRSSVSGIGIDGHKTHSPGKDVNSKEITELLKRFDILHKHFRELQIFCGSFVPRDEVHEAMQAVVNEVKVIRSSVVTIPVFKDALRLKADNEELQRLILTLSSAIGDLNGQSSTSALHAKCLVCDKPVSSLSNTLTYTRARSPNQMTNIQNDRVDDVDTSAAARMPASTFIRLNSPDIGVSTRERSKISNDVTVMKNSIDLPPINTTDKLDSNLTYGNRIRASAGGGIHSSRK